MHLRLSFTLVVFNNLFDYGSNYLFVKHILSMDTTFPGNSALWRAIQSETLIHWGYDLIILFEMVITVFCWMGSIRLWKSVKKDAQTFNEQKALAALGLTLGMILGIAVFLALGGEWFLMWQSEKWNGTSAGMRLIGVNAFVLILLLLPDH